MRRYETFIILDPDLSEDGRAPVIARVEELISEHNGFLVQIDDWGNRKLAYEVKKKLRGYYVRFDYGGDTTLVNEMERFFRINDTVMKFMTVLLDKEADLEKMQEEAAAITAEKSRPKETAEETPPESDTPDAAESETATAEAGTPDAVEPEAAKPPAETQDTADSEAIEAETKTPDVSDAEPTPEASQEQTPEETDEEKK